MNHLLIAAETNCPPENPGCFDVPVLESLFEFPAFLFKDSTWLAFNRTAMLFLISAAIVCGLMIAAFRNPKIVPGKLQAAMEAIVDFIREGIILEVMGPGGLRYLPLMTSMFLFIFVNNFYEIMPLVQFPTTSRMAVPALLAFMVWTMFILVGLKTQGIKYFKNVAVPDGVPGFVLPLVIPIEIVSTFIVRPLTLSVRLFANMMAGHILLAIIFIATNAFLVDFHAGLSDVSINFKGLPIGIIALAFGPAMVAFELMVGALQAYIFTILTAVYISSSMSADH